MSSFNGPGSVTSGLVFDYDMSNDSKSFIGAPTTNLADFPATGYSWVNSGAGSYSDNDTNEELPDIPNSRFFTSPLRVVSCRTTTASVQGLQCGYALTAVSGSTTYTMSLWFKKNRNDMGSYGPYVRQSVNNNWQGTFDYNGETNNALWPTDQWIRIKSTFTTSSNETSVFLSNYIGAYVGDKVCYAGGQLEQKSFASSLAQGTRSNTQSLLDLTNNSSITASSLTYSDNNVFSFNGGGDTMDCGNPSILSSIAGTSAVSVEAWVNLSGYGSSSYGVITHKGYPWTWLMENPGNTMRIRFYLSSSGDVYCPDSSTHALNTWYHFVGTYDGSYMRFYRNGVLTNSVAGSGTLGGAGSNHVIGSYSGAYFSQGKIPVVKIYNRTLSNAEIQQNFQALRGRYGI